MGSTQTGVDKNTDKGQVILLILKMHLPVIAIKAMLTLCEIYIKAILFENVG